MNSNLTAATRICGHQDCNERTSRPNHPLCYEHYQDFQEEFIDECPNCSEVYKPADYPVCRICYTKEGQPSQRTESGDHRQPQNDDRGWNQQPYLEDKETAPLAVKAVQRVRKNMKEHPKECENHESNTTQYLVEPMLWGLSWDVFDPSQVIKEFKPAGKRPWGQAIAVDIALFEEGVPKVFIEVKRLDRDYDPDYKAQLDKYAYYLDEGIAGLTNGKFWKVHRVVNGDTEHLITIPIAEGDAESVAEKLNNAIGRDAISDSNPKPTDPETIAENLRKYREREATRRNHPAYTILKDETINLIATQRPADLHQLGDIKGVGPSTIDQHGAAIITIVRGTS